MAVMNIIPPQRRAPLPFQLCTADRSVLLSAPAAWAWTVKYDGFRAQLHSARLALLSRQNNSLVGGFPDAVAAAGAALGDEDVVLDCELVVLDEHAKPDFGALSARAGCRGRAAERAASGAPAVLVAFDVLYAPGGRDVRHLPWRDRRVLLEGLGLSQTLATGGSALVCAPAYDDGAALLAATAEQRLEGVVAARRDAPYRPGRAGGYVKVKHSFARDLQGDGRGWRRHSA